MSLRRRLQRETAQLHDMLDGLAESRGWFESRAGYGRWLAGTYTFHVRVAEALAGVAPDLVKAQRLQRLAEDVVALGETPRLIGRAQPIQIADRIEALGVAYVTEGATLGARVLTKRAEALGLGCAAGGRYLSVEARDLTSWGLMLAVLDEARLDEFDVARVAAASVKTFNLALECLDDTRDI